jgi:hypothetical protein
MTAHNRKLKIITFTLNSVPFQCQLQSWKLNNNSPDGDRFYTYCADGEFIEDAEPDYSFDLKFLADWTLGGVSDYLWSNNLQVVGFVLDHLPDIVGEHVRWSGNAKIKAPTVGGDVRTTELTEAVLKCIGIPAYARL